MLEADAPCAPDAERPAMRSAACHAATHRAPRRASRSRAVCACHQDTRVGGVRPSAQASSPESAVSGHTATARDPGVCATAVADRPGLPPVSAPCRPDRVGPASWCGHIHGSGCGGLGPRSALACVVTGPGRGPDSWLHVRQHSSVSSCLFAWQHLSPSGPVVLHLELELKLNNFSFTTREMIRVIGPRQILLTSQC